MSELDRLRDRVAELEDAMGLTAEIPRELIPRDLSKSRAARPSTLRFISLLLAQGEIAGMEGKTRQSPWSVGSPQEQAWLAGWSDGQTALMSGFKKLEAKAAAEPEAEGDEAEED